MQRNGIMRERCLRRLSRRGCRATVLSEKRHGDSTPPLLLSFSHDASSPLRRRGEGVTRPCFRKSATVTPPSLLLSFSHDASSPLRGRGERVARHTATRRERRMRPSRLSRAAAASSVLAEIITPLRRRAPVFSRLVSGRGAPVVRDGPASIRTLECFERSKDSNGVTPTCVNLNM